MQRSYSILATSVQPMLSRCCHLTGLRDKCPYQVLARHTWLHRKYCTRNVPKVHQVVYDPKPDMSEEEVKHLRLEPVIDPPEPQLRRYALLLSFNGQGFYGMQRNSTNKSVEDLLHHAMLQAGLITQEEVKVPQLFSFQRASRTDKGVSAARLLVSGKFYCEKSDFKEKINQHLSDQVRVIAAFRTIQNFSCKTWCDSRTYSYTCPTFAFASVTEIVEEGYRLSESALEEIRRLFAEYIGSHNFHNFTSGVKPEDKQAWRRVLEIECGEPFECKGLEWITIKIRGMSFLLHQIRKMIGLVMAIRRGLASTDFISQAFTRDFAFLPIAPGLGLVLENQHYDYYNKKFASDDSNLDVLVWDSVAEEIEEFRQRVIMTPIMETELREKSMFKWLSTLCSYSYEMHKTDRRGLMLGLPLVAFVGYAQHHQLEKGNSVYDVSSASEGKHGPESTAVSCSVSAGS